MDFLGQLHMRARLVRSVRAFFEARGFLEVETPVRIAAPAPETHIDCPVVIAAAAPEALAHPTFLRASPELQMKKLLAMGLEKIYQIGPCFREGEEGRRHHAEFTMLEWYRAHADYLDIAGDMEALIGEVWRTCRGESLPPFARITVREAYREWAGWDPFLAFDQDRFDYDMAVKIEPRLPQGPVFLMDYPPQAAALSRLRPASSPGSVAFAERWELYFSGLELANAFTELTDAREQRMRFEEARAARAAFGESDYPLDEEFLSLLERMPPAGGVALGIDRLAMLCGRAERLSDVRVY